MPAMNADIETYLPLLRQSVEAVYPLPEEDWRAFAAVWQLFSARRKAILTAEGQTEQYVYFVLEGVQRAYAVDDAGKEATLVFTYPPSFSGVADSFLLQQPSRYFFETLTPSRFLRAPFREMDALMWQYHALERMMRLAVSQTLAGVLVRQIETQSFTAEQRFRALLARSPHLLHLVPHKYLANYLGMDPTNFSKLLGQVRL
jgi:CRP-like cAMP-binding protein